MCHDDGMDLPTDELQWRFETSGGPGGQHANRSATRAIVTFDVAASRILDDETRQRIVDGLGTVVVVEADDTRSQWQNRQIAVERLLARLEEAAQPPPPPRAPTKPPPASRRKRVSDKRRLGEKKRLRQPPDDGD